MQAQCAADVTEMMNTGLHLDLVKMSSRCRKAQKAKAVQIHAKYFVTAAARRRRCVHTDQKLKRLKW